MATKEARALPTTEELTLADHKLGSARGDLDAFLTAIESQSDLSMEQELALISRSPFPESPPLDLDVLAQIVVFATDVLADAAALEELARKLLNGTMALIHENSDSDRGRFARYQQTGRIQSVVASLEREELR